MAEQKKRELEQARADAEKLVVKKEGEARARIAEAKSIAEANKMIAQSLTKELVLYEAIKKWNGVQPKIVDSKQLILDIGNLK